MAINTKIVDRVLKIFAEAQNNPSVEEAEIALLIAQWIMAEQGIELADVRLDTESGHKEVVYGCYY